MSLQSVRGTQDLLPEVQVQHNMVIETARGLAEKFGFREMATPIFEFTEVFKRTLGDASDIVNKEMYTFQDKGQEWLTLRPEGTASIARSFISEGLQQRTPFKVFYQGPMFRYERPQKGRFRQFHQFGVELLGAATPFADVEVIALGHQILKALEVDTLSTLEINSIGDAESRKAYVEKLVKYLTEHQLKLSADSQKRLTTNPLRILDSKSAEDQEILKNAPVISECYSETSKVFFDTITAMLQDYGIPYKHNPFLVRGLDYYSHCVFEFKTTALGAQDAILSGGRYDTLIKTMGGPDTPSVGWAAGIERLVMLTPKKAAQTRGVAIIPVHESVEQKAFKMAYDLRVAGIEADIGYSGNMSKRMKRASQKNCIAAIVVGPEEMNRGEVVVKTLDDGQQKTLKLSELEGFLKSLKS